MREERGKVIGNQVISEPMDLWGSITGNVTVVKGGKMYVRGAIVGHLVVEDGGRVHVYGNVSGNLSVAQGAKVILSGIVGGDAANNGGRLYVDNLGKVNGKLIKNGGDTVVDPKAQVPRQEDLKAKA
ncbi:MAG TPA: hypothetical protein VHP11_07405 [Tepidisphaeraceae bacterium]|nr:hypothetical protein [Tepidisphaeraceae bacterium]